MTLDQLKQDIWLKCKKNLINVQVAADKAKVVLPITTIPDAEAVLKALVKRKKPAKPKLDPSIFKRYRDAKYAYEDATTIYWIKDGHFIEPDMPNTATANGLTEFITDFLSWSGHFANRTGNEGRVIIKDGKPKRIPSSSKKGMQDIDTNLKHPDHEFGIPWKIEIKVGSDTHKQHQKDFGMKVSKTGGIYSVVRSAEDFFAQYDRLMIRKTKQNSIFD